MGDATSRFKMNRDREREGTEGRHVHSAFNFIVKLLHRRREATECRRL